MRTDVKEILDQLGIIQRELASGHGPIEFDTVFIHDLEKDDKDPSYEVVITNDGPTQTEAGHLWLIERLKARESLLDDLKVAMQLETVRHDTLQRTV